MNDPDYSNYFNLHPDKDGRFGKYGGSYIPPQLEAIMNEIRDAYDTYNCTGLPAGPISNPGLAAIRAALDPQCDPEVKDCYFFVTDQSGHYYYAKTYAEHQKNCAEADSVNKSLK